MALTVENPPSEYQVYQRIFQFLGFFPQSIGKRSIWPKIYQRTIYWLILPVIMFYPYSSGDSNHLEKSYINRLAKGCILAIGFCTTWVILFESDLTARAQAMIFSKFDEMNFFKSWTGTKSTINRKIIYLAVYSVLNMVVAVVSEFFASQILSSALNLMIYFRCIQIYFFEAAINEKLQLITPKRDDDENSVFVLELKEHRTYSEVEKIKKSLLKIGQMNFFLNKCVGWSLLFITTHFFLVLTCHLYWLFLNATTGVQANSTVGSLCAIGPKIGILLLLSHEISETNSHVRRPLLLNKAFPNFLKTLD